MVNLYYLGFPTSETWSKFFSDKTKDLVRYRRYTFYRENKLRNVFPGVSDLALNLLSGLLVWDPKKRMSAQRAILHPYFYDKPLPKLPDQITALKKFDYYKARVREMIIKKNKY